MAGQPPTRRKRPPPRNKRIVAAAIQLEAEVGDVAANLERIERLVDEAVRAGAAVCWEFARRLGAPVLQASHCGKFRTGFMLAPRLPLVAPYDTEFVGATQIADAEGHVLVQRTAQEGPGVVVAEVALGAREPVRPLEERYWIPELPLFLHAYWHQQNVCGKAYYRARGRAAGLAAAQANAEIAVKAATPPRRRKRA